MGTDEKAYATSASGKHFVFDYYHTGHGFGHATRGVELVLDCGSVQSDALTADCLSSLEKVSDVVPVACPATADESREIFKSMYASYGDARAK